jgi:hypothetical protein
VYEEPTTTEDSYAEPTDTPIYEEPTTSEDPYAAPAATADATDVPTDVPTDIPTFEGSPDTQFDDVAADEPMVTASEASTMSSFDWPTS